MLTWFECKTTCWLALRIKDTLPGERLHGRWSTTSIPSLASGQVEDGEVERETETDTCVSVAGNTAW